MIIMTKSLAGDLTQLGLRSGQTVLVHTSMKALEGMWWAMHQRW